MKYSTQTVTFSDIIRSFWRCARQYTGSMSLIFIAALVGQACGIAIPVYLSRFFNGLVEHAVTPGDAVVEELIGIIEIVMVLYVIQWMSRRTSGLSIIRFELHTMRDLFDTSFAYLIRHSHHFFSSQFSGTLTRRVSKYVYAFETLFDSLAGSFFPTAIYLVGAITVLCMHNLVLGGILAGWSVLFISFQIYISRLRQPLRVARAEADSAVTGGIADAVTNQHAIMLFAAGSHEEDVFGKLVERWRSASARSWTADEYIWASQGILMIGLQLGLLLGAFYFWRRGLLPVGDFVLIQTYALGIIDGLVNVTRELRRVYDAVADAGEMVAILKEPHAIADKHGAAALVPSAGEIVFDDATFSYAAGGGAILERLAITIPGGQKVGVVGKSGAGKSTLAKLLLRHYDVTGGRILVDGSDIRDVTQDSLRSAISFVPQEPLLFHRTIRDNIAYGKTDATNAEIVDAAKRAQAHDFIMRLPQGYETFVGERGVKLSGGERQRIAIARAILKDAPILVLDEATSALDSESELAIQTALRSLMEGKTVIAIAHRLSTLREMDRILVLERGRVIEDGSHVQLLERGGMYASLWNHQAGGFIPDEE
jgi:ATP-binding cassette subfamily B protein